MKSFVFTVFDSCAKVYDRPFVARSEGEALRSFTDIASDDKHPIGQHPEHYSIWRIGMYDDATGKIDTESPVHLSGAVELIKVDLKEVG